MEHLNDSEVLEFASIKEVNAESAALAARVNRHILECAACAKRIKDAVKYLDAACAMALPDFSPSVMPVSEYDISPAEVASAVRELEGQNGAYNY